MEKATSIATCVSSITKNSSSVLLCDNFFVRKNNSTFSIENRYCDILRSKRRSNRESMCRSIAGKRLAVNRLTMFVQSTNKEDWSESNMSGVAQFLKRYIVVVVSLSAISEGRLILLKARSVRYRFRVDGSWRGSCCSENREIH